MAITPTASATAVEEVERVLTTLFRTARLPRVHERLVARAGVSIDQALYPVLVHVEENEPIRLTDLAGVLGVDLSTASRQLKHLEGSGLVDRTSDPDDGRAAVFALSAEGRRVLGRLRDARHTALTRLLAGWDPGDVTELARLLEQLSAGFTSLLETS